MTTEEWRPIRTHEPYYSVSSHGRVRAEARVVVRKDGTIAHRRARILKPHQFSSGHLHIGLYDIRPGPGTPERTTYSVHRLVLEAFVGPCPEGMECRHLNGQPADNRVENLAWGTPKENQFDRVLHGTDGRGERNPIAKLTTEAVTTMRALAKDGVTTAAIALQFGVATPTAWHAITGLTWNHVPGALAPRQLRKLTQEQANEIRLRRAAGLTYASLAAAYGVSPSAISDICKGRRWLNKEAP